MTAPARHRGFTLLEVLVATVILAVMGLMAYRAVSETRVAVTAAEEHMGRLREVQRALQLLVTDFRTLTRRPVRESIGDGYRATLLRDPNAIAVAELSHGGWANGAGTPRGTGQRVVYRVEDGKLFREHWNVMDPTLATPLVRRELLDGVERLEIRYLDRSRQWVEQWPPFGNTADLGFYQRPLAAAITLVLADYGELTRLVEISG